MQLYSPLTALHSVLERRVPPQVREWLSSVIGDAEVRFEEHRFLYAYAAAARMLGKVPLGLDLEDVVQLERAGVCWPLVRSLDELGRVWLLLSAAAVLPHERGQALVEACYEAGDVSERRAVLRSLALLPSPGRFVPLAAEACRSHIQPIFEAVACENPYPVDQFPELTFNQMVLKALFTNVPLARIMGLERRMTAELKRMAADYASERRAAGRPVQEDVQRLLAMKPSAVSDQPPAPG